MWWVGFLQLRIWEVHEIIVPYFDLFGDHMHVMGIDVWGIWTLPEKARQWDKGDSGEIERLMSRVPNSVQFFMLILYWIWGTWGLWLGPCVVEWGQKAPPNNGKPMHQIPYPPCCWIVEQQKEDSNFVGSDGGLPLLNLSSTPLVNKSCKWV